MNKIISMLNYLSSRLQSWESFLFLGFIDVGQEFFGYEILEGYSRITALILAKSQIGWGDSNTIEESIKFPYVLYLSGVDDENYYMRFSTKELAIEHGNNLIINGGSVNITVDCSVENNKWLWQN
jgi:hypothetical protein